MLLALHLAHLIDAVVFIQYLDSILSGDGQGAVFLLLIGGSVLRAYLRGVVKDGGLLAVVEDQL